MMKLIDTIQQVMSEKRDYPFSVYTSLKEQQLFNVPITKPMLIVVLSGSKALGDEGSLCTTGDFVFLSDNPAIDMRNIPSSEAYFALLITFEPSDFEGLALYDLPAQHYRIGKAVPELLACLHQFVESTRWAPESVWSLRKREIIELLCQTGHKDILKMMGRAEVSHKLHDILLQNIHRDITVEVICDKLAMSESTLRRKLKAEGTSVQALKDQTRLSLGLDLLQTTEYAIGLIAEKCGYQSQSKFTERFKKRFGLTPSALRKTKVIA